LNSEFFKLAQKVLKQYQGINTTDKLLETLEPLLKTPPDELRDMHEQAKLQLSDSALSLKKFSTTLTDSNVAYLVKFDREFQSRILEVKTKLGYLNEIIDETRYYFKLSFQPGITTENHRIANINLVNEYKNVASQARHTIEIIGQLLEQEGSPSYEEDAVR
jgi:hypothetical protein